MHPRLLPVLLALLSLNTLHAQWVPAGLFSSSIHFQAGAFHTADSGLFVYGANNPGPSPSGTEGGILLTDDGAASGGYYLWYEPSTNLEDIAVKNTPEGPIYLAAGHELYNRSIVVRPFNFASSPLAFDSVRTGVGRYYRAIRMRNDLTAFAAGGDAAGNGIIDMSTDTGATWSNIAVLAGQPVSRLHFVNDQLGFAATGGYRRLANNGIFLPDSGAIYRTTNGGLTWQQVHADNTAGFSAVAFSSTTNGVATSNNGAILRTTNGGTTWTPATNNFPEPYVLTGATFRSDGAGFIIGYSTDGTAGYILLSQDGGATWNLHFSTAALNSARRLYDIYFHDSTHGYAMGQIRPLRSNGLVTSVQEQFALQAAPYPNPTDGDVTVLVEEAGANVEIFDATGRQMWQGRTTQAGPVQLPLGALPAGAYTVRVRTERGVQSQVVIRQ